MLTSGQQTANAAVMLSISELAERDGVAKPTVSIAVKRLIEKHDLQVERDRRGRVSAVNAAQYDMLRERTGDPSKAQAPRKAERDKPREGDSYDDALRLKTIYGAERERLRLAEEKGELIPAVRVADAASSLADVIVSVLDRLPQAADDIAAAVAKDGAHGARAELKRLAVSSRRSIADVIAGLTTSKDGEPRT